MQYAKIENGTVAQVILSDAGFAATLDGEWVSSTDGVGIGHAYSNGIFSAPVIPEPPVVIDPCLWLIDTGPFYDRFGAAKMDVLTSTDTTIKAIMADVQIRKWIDLERADVASSLAYIGTLVAALTPAIRTAILTTPVAEEENRALRKLYFS